jgi:hypothetical protein
MDSEADLSLFTRSATQDLTETRSRGQSAHTTWIYSRTARVADREDPTQKYYIYCIGIEELIFKTSVTTNIQNHLRLKHKIIVKQTLGLIQATVIKQLQELYLRVESSG